MRMRFSLSGICKFYLEMNINIYRLTNKTLKNMRKIVNVQFPTTVVGTWTKPFHSGFRLNMCRWGSIEFRKPWSNTVSYNELGQNFRTLLEDKAGVLIHRFKSLNFATAIINLYFNNQSVNIMFYIIIMWAIIKHLISK